MGAMVAPIRNSPQFGEGAAHIAKFLIVLAVMVGSCVLTNLGTVSVLGGAIGLLGLNAIPPCVVGIFLLDKHRVMMIGLLVLGLVMFVVGLMYTDNYVDQV